MKKFYIVKDYKDLTSGQIIPQKVIDYLPSNILNMHHYPGISAQVIRPVPVKRGEIPPIQLGNNQLMTSISSPLSYQSIGPSADITINRYPLTMTDCETKPDCGQKIIVPTPPILTPFGSVNQLSGPPIIKLTPMIKQNVPGIIKIITHDNKTFTLNIPYNMIRNVINEIYLRKVSLDTSKPKVTFRIITPTLDTSVFTTSDNMFNILQLLNSKYTNIIYKHDDGKTESLNSLLLQLADLLKYKL